MNDGPTKMRELIHKAFAAAGAEVLGAELLSAFPDDVLEHVARLVGMEVGEAERKRCAKLMHVTSAELLLAGGEMTAQELRSIKAVLTWKEAQILKGET